MLSRVSRFITLAYFSVVDNFKDDYHQKKTNLDLKQLKKNLEFKRKEYKNDTPKSTERKKGEFEYSENSFFFVENDILKIRPKVDLSKNGAHERYSEDYFVNLRKRKRKKRTLGTLAKKMLKFIYFMKRHNLQLTDLIKCPLWAKPHQFGNRSKKFFILVKTSSYSDVKRLCFNEKMMVYQMDTVSLI